MVFHLKKKIFSKNPRYWKKFPYPFPKRALLDSERGGDIKNSKSGICVKEGAHRSKNALSATFT